MSPPSEPIKAFLKGYTNKGTRYAYRTGILAFLNFIYGRQMEGRSATEKEFAKFETLARKYLAEDRDHVSDLISFIQDMAEKSIPPKSANVRGGAVRQWFIENDITFTDKNRQQMRRVKPKGGRKTNIRYADTHIIREIIAQGDIRLRALVLTLASSGVRIGEALELTWSQVRIPDRTKEPEKDKLTSIYIPDSKTGLSRTAWISREAEEALLEWKKATPAYLKTVTFKGLNLGVKKSNTDDRVFPFRRTAAHVAWDNAVKAAGYYQMDERTHRTQLNIHRLRGFFKTKTMGIIGSDFSEMLLGHGDAYGDAYRKVPDEILAVEYQKCERVLTIASPHGVELEVSTKFEALEKENRELKAKLESLGNQNNEVSDLKKQMEEMQSLVAYLAKSQGIDTVELGIKSVDLNDDGSITTHGGKTHKIKF